MTLYESEATCGGHTLTDDSSGYPVDLGFQVCNLTTYPHLMGLFESLGVDTEPSDMSFALSVDGGRLEWASHSLSTIFAQRGNLVSPSFLTMIRDVLHFGKNAPRVLDKNSLKKYEKMTLGAYLKEKRYSRSFIDNYILPMCAAVWSVPSAQVLEFPVAMLVRFWVNHHLLDIFQRPVWRVVVGRSRTYVDRIIQELPDVRTSTQVLGVRSVRMKESTNDITPSKVAVKTKNGESYFDDVVLSTHSDVSLKLLGGNGFDGNMKCESDLQEIFDVLSAIKYNENDVWLHKDISLMPKNRSAWASWNCIGSSDTDAAKPVCVTYWINSLQSLPPDAPDLFVTLNPIHEPNPKMVLKRINLAHPVFSEGSVAAQSRLLSVQGKSGIYLAGAWAGYGFHEDGIQSAINVVEKMGGSIPWKPRSSSPKISVIDRAAIYVFDRFARSTIKDGHLRFILPNGEELHYGSPKPPVGGEKEAWRGRPPLDATIRIYDASFFRKVISRHDTGLGESYMDGDYEVIPGLGCRGGDLGSLLAVATANATNIEDQRGLLGIFNRLGDRALHIAHLSRSNTANNARRNIEEHYDAGNAMYKIFLDKSMTYSCGIWSDKNGSRIADSLYESQMNKIDELIEKSDISEGHNVLEIGCGWGSFAIRAASTRGCQVTGLTLSKEQLAEAQARVKAAGLEEKITLLLCDYRDCPRLGSYDRVISCEMIEAVGHEHLDAYFATVGAALKPGGKAVLQIISEPDERYEAYCNSSDFIREHIFPGGHLPSIGACIEATRGTGLSMHGCEDIGPDYAVTLRAWRKAWEENQEQIVQLGYPLRFWKKYRFYFAYCEAAFDARYIHTFQVTWVKDGDFTLSNEELSTALERSKSGKLSSKVLTRKIDSPEDGIQANVSSMSNAIKARHGSDILTQSIMCLYFFLAGAAISTSATLWLLPLATILSFLTYAASSFISYWFVPKYNRLSSHVATRWNFESVQLVFLLASSISSLLTFSRMPMGEFSQILLAAKSFCWIFRSLTAASAGFFAFVLWALVQIRLYGGSHMRLAQYVVLVSFFAVAAHKDMYTNILSAALVPQLSTAMSIIYHRAADLGMSHKFPLIFKVLHVVDIVLLLILRVVGYSSLLAFILVHSSTFEFRSVWWAGVGGLSVAIINNLIELKNAFSTRSPYTVLNDGKPHTE